MVLCAKRGNVTEVILTTDYTNEEIKARLLVLDKSYDVSEVKEEGLKNLIPFNTLRGNTKDVQRQMLIDKGRPGTSCPNKFIQLNYEFKETGLCTASREYQHLKLKEIDALELSSEEKVKQINKVTEKSCICVGLGTSTLILNNVSTKKTGDGVSICPGPNMAYYDKIVSLQGITDHIYGRKSMLTRTDRPNVFIKELSLYITHLQEKVEEVKSNFDKKQIRSLTKFKKNLEAGINYYNEIFTARKQAFVEQKDALLEVLKIEQNKLITIGLEIENLK